MAVNTSPLPTTLSVDMLRYLHDLTRRDIGQYGRDYPPAKKRMIEEWLQYVEIKLDEYDASRPKQEKLL